VSILIPFRNNSWFNIDSSLASEARVWWQEYSYGTRLQCFVGRRIDGRGRHRTTGAAVLAKSPTPQLCSSMWSSFLFAIKILSEKNARFSCVFLCVRSSRLLSASEYLYLCFGASHPTISPAFGRSNFPFPALRALCVPIHSFLLCFF
jgi:hypothetical protein